MPSQIPKPNPNLTLTKYNVCHSMQNPHEFELWHTLVQAEHGRVGFAHRCALQGIPAERDRVIELPVHRAVAESDRAPRWQRGARAALGRY